MSSETDQPRQRTVAELLAAHGDSGATGRRRRRREADEEAAVPPERFDGVRAMPRDEPGLPPPVLPERPALPDRSILREPVPRDGGGLSRYRAEDYRLTPLERDDRAAPAPERERPTEQFARLRAEPDTADRAGFDRGRHDADVTGPIPVSPGLTARAPSFPGVPPDALPPRRSRHAPPPEPRDGGPGTVIGAPPDPGPATQASPPVFDDHPAGLEGADLDEIGLDGARVDEDLDAAGAYPDDEPAPAPPSRSAVGQMWAAVVAQWIAGAIGGAGLWVGFRYLWRNLPVVATAAAVVVTVGLVVIVRALLHNDDRRTTVFAVLVGLLLTVSPAILVLMGR